MSKCGVFSGPYISVFGVNTEIYGVKKYGPEITPYLDTFLAVSLNQRNFSTFHAVTHLLSSLTEIQYLQIEQSKKKVYQ